MTTKEELFNTERPTNIDVWAPWCVPCRQTKPVLEKLAREYEGRVDFKTINADKNQDLVRELKIFGIPTLLVVQDGSVLRRITGAQQETWYQNLFEQLATGDISSLAGPSQMDRILRLGAGAALVLLALSYSVTWLLPLGLIIMFTGVYDRCPVWQAISGRIRGVR